MRKSALYTTLIAALAATLSAQTGTPTPDQVIDKYVGAIGGKAAIEKLTSRYMKGTVDVVTFNATGTFEEYRKAPNKRLLKSEFDGYGLVIQACDGVTAWAEEPQNGRRDVTGPELAAQKRSSDFFAEVHIRQHYPKMAIAKGKAGTRDAWVIEATPAEGNAEKHYYDVESGLLLRVEAATPEGAVAIAYEDYKEVDGVRLPHTWKIDMPQVSLVYKASEVKHGIAIEDAKFAKPAGN